MRFNIFFFAVLLFPVVAEANYTLRTQPSDVDYYIHKNPAFSLVFSKDFLKNKKEDFLHVHKKISYYTDVYKEIFTKDLKEKPIYIFLSHRNQVSNALAGGIPFLRVLFFLQGWKKCLV